MTLDPLRTGPSRAGTLNNLLTGYEPSAILREQAQNADDACRKAGVEGTLRVEFTPNALLIENPSVLDEKDWRQIAQPASRGKADDPEQTGEFGVGFWSVLHLTDVPIITSGAATAAIDQLSEEPAYRTAVEPPLQGTRFELPFRLTQTKAGELLGVGPVTSELLDELEQSFADQLHELLLFTRALNRVELHLRKGEPLVGTRRKTPLSPGSEVSTVQITVETSGSSASRQVLVVDGEVKDPPKGRNTGFSAAFPLDADDSGELEGRVYCTFPTETISGLGFAVNGHFFPEVNRRALDHEGPKGSWNSRLFEFAGELVGRNIAAIMAADLPLEYEQRLRWFVPRSGVHPRVQGWQRSCLERIDERARQSAVIPSRDGALKRGSELHFLDSAIEELLFGAMPDAITRPTDATTADVFKRWGVKTLGKAEVARWLRSNCPVEGTALDNAPIFLNAPWKVQRLLGYVRGAETELGAAVLSVGSDERFYPLGSPRLPASVPDLASLIAGLSAPTLHKELEQTIARTRAPVVTPTWLYDALVADAERIAGGDRKMPLPSVGALQSFEQTNEALAVLAKTGRPLTGVPLAVRPDKTIAIFDETTVVGLPPGAHRGPATELLERLGATVLHERIDDSARAGGDVRRLSARRLAKLVDAAGSRWSPIEDCRGLLLCLEGMWANRLIGPEELTSFADRPIWPADDGTLHPIHELFLPAPARRPREDERGRIISTKLVSGDDEVSRQCLRVLADRFDRYPLGSVEDVVAACEQPPGDIEDLFGLLDELVEVRSRLHRQQKDRLKEAAFVPCKDGLRRRPAEALVLQAQLPHDIGRRSVVSRVASDRRLLELLDELGIQRRAAVDDLVALAQWIATQPVSDRERDPGHALWQYLLLEDSYAQAELQRLRSISWVVSEPGPHRRAPSDLIDPQYSWAELLFASPARVGTPPARLRDGLGLKPSLTPSDLIALAEESERRKQRLPDAYFRFLNNLATTDGQSLARLRDIAFFPAGGQLHRPRDLIGEGRAALWRHLRTAVSTDALERFERLFAAWGVDLDADVDWRDHADVLKELADLQTWQPRDLALADERFASIADAFRRGDLVDADLINRRCIPTSKGVCRPADAFRRDLPPAICDRLASQLAVARESVEISSLLSQLPLKSLRDEIRLNAATEGARPDASWQPRLRTHRRNVLRFLRYAGAVLPDDWPETWPPIVEAVRAIRVKAEHDGRILDEWDDESYLSSGDAAPRLYVRGSTARTRSIVDAIATVYRVEPGTKTLLVAVLDSPSEEAGSECLDYDNVPPLFESDDPWSTDNDLLTFDIAETDTDTDADDADQAEADTAPVEPAEVVPADDEADEAHPGFAPEPAIDAADERRGDRPSPDGEAEPTGPQPAQPVAEEGAPPPARPEPPRVPVDYPGLASKGFKIERRVLSATDEADFGADEPKDPKDAGRRTLVLSFYDVTYGLLPLRRNEVRALAGPNGVRTVHIFGEHYAAEQAGDFHVRVHGAVELFEKYQVVAGTVVHLRPGAPGVIEAEIREDPHIVSNVWLLEIDEDGQLVREQLPAIEVRWETVDIVYKANRRWEDVEALRAEATSSGLDLLIRVFEREGAEGLTADQVWELVAVYRLLSPRWIRTLLSQQSGLFTREGDLWFMSGDRIFLDSRAPATTPQRSSADAGAKARRRVRQLAEELASILNELGDDSLRMDLAALLNLHAVSAATEEGFDRGLSAYLQTGDEQTLSSLEREMLRYPELSLSAIASLEDAPVGALQRGTHLVDVILDIGVPEAVVRARDLALKIDALAGSELPTDPLAAARFAVEQVADGVLPDSAAAEALSNAYVSIGLTDSFESPEEVKALMMGLELLSRRADGRVSDAALVLAARANAIAKVAASIDDTDFHSDLSRQELLITLRLIRGDEPLAVIDVLNEYGKFLERDPSTGERARQVFRVVGTYARATGAKGPSVSFAASRLANLSTAEDSESKTTPFLASWCELARISYPSD